MGDMLKSGGFWWTILFGVLATIYYFAKFRQNRNEEFADKMLYSCIAVTVQTIVIMLLFAVLSSWNGIFAVWFLVWIPYLLMRKSRNAVKQAAMRMDERITLKQKAMRIDEEERKWIR